jgi:hypothetical protein
MFKLSRSQSVGFAESPNNMLIFFTLATLWPALIAATPPPATQEIVEAQEVRSLSGKLDAIPVFNSYRKEFCSLLFLVGARPTLPRT